MANEGQRNLIVAHAQHLPDVGQADVGVVRDHQLLQQVLGIAKTAGRAARESLESLRLGADAFAVAELGQAPLDVFLGQAVEVEPLAPGDHRSGHLVRLRGGQYKDGVGGRLLQRLEEGVEGGLSQHVDLVNDVDLERALGGGEVDLLAQAADVVDAAVAGGVDLDQVHGPGLVDGGAGAALVARLAVPRLQAADGLGKNAGGAGLARAPRPAEQVRVGHPALHDGLPQRAGHVLLAFHVRQQAGTPLAIEYLGQLPVLFLLYGYPGQHVVLYGPHALFFAVVCVIVA